MDLNVGVDVDNEYRRILVRRGFKIIFDSFAIGTGYRYGSVFHVFSSFLLLSLVFAALQICITLTNLSLRLPMRQDATNTAISRHYRITMTSCLGILKLSLL